jgi:hypothetical protein
MSEKLVDFGYLLVIITIIICITKCVSDDKKHRHELEMKDCVEICDDE